MYATYVCITSQVRRQQNVVQKGKQTVGKLLNNIARNHSQSTFIPRFCCASSWKPVVCCKQGSCQTLKPAQCCTLMQICYYSRNSD